MGFPEMIRWLQQVPPVPNGIEVQFVRGGWRGVERTYCASTGLLRQWIGMNGGRLQYLRRSEPIQALAKIRPGSGQ
jgi:hypothetical protein